MCGLAGVISVDGSLSDHESMAEKMANAIIHRGPDSQDSWINDTQELLLIHCRLAIQDISPLGHQPMSSSSGRFTIVYNGEIYNFQSIAKELNELGVHFKGHSDTEIFLEAIEKWGIDSALERIKGMFAFALWDDELKTLTLARDRMGEKPLYYGLIEDKIFFASELKAIYAVHHPSNLTIDKASLGSFLRYGYVTAPHSIFSEIKKLEAGTSLTLNLNPGPNDLTLSEQITDISRPKTYWSLETVYEEKTNQRIEDKNKATDQLDKLLNKVVSEQCIADVPLGTFLSGGIDSSLISAIAQANSNKPIDTFTIGFHEKSFNEAEHAKRVAEHIGSQHHEIYASPEDVLNTVYKMPTVYDEPFASSAAIPTYLVSELARQNVTVSLSGDGGDELFTGYNRYGVTVTTFNKIKKLPKFLRGIFSKLITRVSPVVWEKLYISAMQIMNKKGGANFGLKVHKLAELLQQESLVSTYKYLCGHWQSPELLIKGKVVEPEFPFAENFEENFIESAMLWDQKYYLPDDNLLRSDRASMAVSLEMRLPLLDQEVVEYSWQLPTSMKLNENKSKWILREVLYKYVPKTLIERPKMGFSVPVAKWLRTDLKEWAQSLLDSEFIEKQNLFNSEPIQKTFHEHLSGRYDHSHKLWILLMFQSWYKQYILNET